MSLKHGVLSLVIILLAASCSEDDSTVDPALTDNPIVFSDLQLSHFLVDTDTLNVVPGEDKSPDDPVTIPLRVDVRMTRPDAPEEPAAIRCAVRPEGGSQPVAEMTVSDAVSGVYSFDFSLNLARGDVGDYTVEVTADGEAAVSSALAKLRVINGANPPEILEVRAPDTLELQSQTVVFDMSIHVVDGSGQQDIKQVFFNSYRPDGTPSSGNPFTMADDGNVSQGDMVAGDGWYSIRVQLPPTAQKGEYDFQFRAVDYSNLTSKVVIHKIFVR